MTTPRPPSPEYYRAFVRNWPGGCKDGCAFEVVHGNVWPHSTRDGSVCIVGREWLRRNGIRPEVLAEKGCK